MNPRLLLPLTLLWLAGCGLQSQAPATAPPTPTDTRAAIVTAAPTVAVKGTAPNASPTAVPTDTALPSPTLTVASTETPTPTPSPAVTPQPTSTLPPPTATLPAPTSTRIPATATSSPPTVTPAPTGTASPTACAYAWFMANPPAGCPDQPAIYAQTIAQRFERGLLLWRARPDTYGSQIYAFFQDGQWPAWNPTNDRWRQGLPDSDPAIVPPAGLYQPVRGFGLFWRDAYFNPAGSARDRLGWALESEYALGERALQCRVQGDWAAGCFLGGPGDQILLVEANNAWSTWTGPTP
jgi:hypothetical protein